MFLLSSCLSATSSLILSYWCLFPSSVLHLLFARLEPPPHLFSHRPVVLCIPPPSSFPPSSFLNTANGFLFHSVFFLMPPRSPPVLTSIRSPVSHLAPFEVDPSVCLWLCRGGGGWHWLVISLRWLSEHTAITKVATPLRHPASVCVCTSVSVQYGYIVTGLWECCDKCLVLEVE